MHLSLVSLAALATLAVAAPLEHGTSCSGTFPPNSGCSLAHIRPSLPKGQHEVRVPANSRTVAVTVGIGNVTFNCLGEDTYTATTRAALYDVGPRLARCHKPLRTLTRLVDDVYLTFSPAVSLSQNADDYLGFHSPISYTNTTPSSPCGNQTPRTVLLPSFTLYHSSPACPITDRYDQERHATFVEVGSIASPQSRGARRNMDWVRYDPIAGNSHATANTGLGTVLRTETRAGVIEKEARCRVNGQVEIVPFVAVFWFFLSR
ncbi:hypothetical protein JCM10207_002866 [Rhodosporidiobolus poonsookiae]